MLNYVHQPVGYFVHLSAGAGQVMYSWILELLLGNSIVAAENNVALSCRVRALT